MITHNKTGLYKKIAISFLAVSLVIVCAIFYLAFSWATITVTPKSDDFSASYSVDIADASTAQQGISVPGKVVEQVLDGEGVFNATGSATESLKAEGTVTVVNTTGAAQPLRETTRILSEDGTLFRTKEYVNVLPQSEIAVPVIADKVGEIGQISARLTIPGLSQEQQARIYAQGYTPKSSGSETNTIISKEDVAQAEATMIAKLQDSFIASLEGTKAALSAGKGGGATQIISNTIVSSMTDKPVGEKTGQFGLTIKVRFAAVLFDEVTMRDHVGGMLKARLAPGQELLPLGAQDVQYSLERMDASKGSAVLKVIARAGKILAQDARMFDKERLVGLSKEEIQAYFATSPDIIETKVQLYPFWVVRAPLMPDHINILIKK